MQIFTVQPAVKRRTAQPRTVPSRRLFCGIPPSLRPPIRNPPSGCTQQEIAGRARNDEAPRPATRPRPRGRKKQSLPARASVAYAQHEKTADGKANPSATKHPSLPRTARPSAAVSAADLRIAANRAPHKSIATAAQQPPPAKRPFGHFLALKKVSPPGRGVPAKRPRPRKTPIPEKQKIPNKNGLIRISVHLKSQSLRIPLHSIHKVRKRHPGILQLLVPKLCPLQRNIAAIAPRL